MARAAAERGFTPGRRLRWGPPPVVREPTRAPHCATLILLHYCHVGGPRPEVEFAAFGEWVQDNVLWGCKTITICAPVWNLGRATSQDEVNRAQPQPLPRQNVAEEKSSGFRVPRNPNPNPNPDPNIPTVGCFDVVRPRWHARPRGRAVLWSGADGGNGGNTGGGGAEGTGGENTTHEDTGLYLSLIHI